MREWRRVPSVRPDILQALGESVVPTQAHSPKLTPLCLSWSSQSLKGFVPDRFVNCRGESQQALAVTFTVSHRKARTLSKHDKSWDVTLRFFPRYWKRSSQDNRRFGLCREWGEASSPPNGTFLEFTSLIPTKTTRSRAPHLIPAANSNGEIQTHARATR